MPKTPIISEQPSIPFTEEKRTQVRHTFQYVLWGLVAGIILLIFHSLFIGYFDAIPKVEVPNTLGLTLQEAERTFDDVGLRSKLAGYVDDERISANCVSSTIPEAGRVVKKNRIIKYFISKGSEDSAVPDLLERDFSTAQTVAQNKGFVLEVKEKAFSNKVARNQVISQDPAAQTIVRKGATVSVVLSNGYPVVMQVVDKSDQNNIRLRLSIKVEQSWDPQNIFVYTQDTNGRKKVFEKLLAPGETKDIEVTAGKESVVEVYYFNDLAFKQELKLLDEKQ
jgi:beta-lactam-binding protein with PASTA domain